MANAEHAVPVPGGCSTRWWPSDAGFVVRYVGGEPRLCAATRVAVGDIQHAVNNAMAIDGQDDDTRL